MFGQDINIIIASDTTSIVITLVYLHIGIEAFNNNKFNWSIKQFKLIM